MNLQVRIRTIRPAYAYAFWLNFFLGVASAAGQGAGDGSQRPLNRPQRNNNPLNIKYGGATKHWVDRGLATIEVAPATDGGRFLAFRDVETGFQAARDLLGSHVYRDLDLDAALRKWSGRGYGAEIAPDLVGKRVGQLTNPELSRVVEIMARREGFYAGGYRPPRGISSEQRALIEDVSQKVSETFGRQSPARPAQRIDLAADRELVEDVSRKLAEAFGGRPAAPRRDEGSEQPRRTPRIDVGSRTSAAPQPTPPRELPTNRRPDQDASGPVRGTAETLGPFRFVIPEGWAVSDRHNTDGRPSLGLGKGGVSDHRLFITLMEHPGMGPAVPYAPEPILDFTKAGMVRNPAANGGRFGVVSFRPGVVKGRTTVGKERIPAVWATEADSRVLLFEYGSKVYMCSAAGAEALSVADQLLRTVELQERK